MNDDLPVTEVRLAPAAPSETGSGLLGYVSFQLGALVLDGIALRRTRDGRLALSFPERRDSSGRRRPLVRPLDDAARRAIEAAVLAALSIEEGAA